MALNQASAPAVEPVSLAEVKEHLRLNTATFADDIDQQQSIVPGNHSTAASYSLEGATVATNVYSSLVMLNSGTYGTGGIVDCKIQESEDAATFTDWSGSAFTQVTTANDNAIQEIDYTGGKPYIRGVATIAGAVCDFSVTVIRDAVTNNEDDYISNFLIPTSRRQVEKLANRTYINQTWELYMDEFPLNDFIDIPLPPLSTVTSIIYTLTGGTATTLTAGNYIIDKTSTPGRVVLGYNETWPTATLQPANGVKVTFDAGYGATGGTVPEDAKQAILLMCGHFYENREETTTLRLSRIPYGISNILGLDRIVEFG